jgi:thiol-disulfide isomerase/thioredoxin
MLGRWIARGGFLLALGFGVGCEPAPRADAPVSLSPWLGQPAPALTGALTWINSPEIQLDQLRGAVTLIHFFDYNCVNCIRTYPYLQEWRRRYADAGLRVIGVHSPQYAFAMDPANVLSSLRRHQLTHPVAVDSNLQIAGAYTNRFWPRMFLVDRAGTIQFDQIGEGGYVELEQTIQKLLREMDPRREFPPVMTPVHDFDRPGAVCYPVTAELYLGHIRGTLANLEGAPSNSVVKFVLPAQRAEGRVFASGAWSVFDEYMRHAEDSDDLDDCLWVKYRAVEVNIVMKPESVYWMEVFVQQDNQPIPRTVAGADVQYTAEGASYIRVDEPRMYSVINRQPYGAYELRVCARGKGLSVYSFSFGTCAIPAHTEQLR